MANVLDLRRRIRSVKNTRQITKAMKMVSAAKLRRAQERAHAGAAVCADDDQRAGVADAAHRSLQRKDGRPVHPLLVEREEKNVLVVVIAGDKGFAGAFNSNIVKAAQFIDERRQRARRSMSSRSDARRATCSASAFRRRTTRRQEEHYDNDLATHFEIVRHRAQPIEVTGDHPGLLLKLDFDEVSEMAHSIIARYTRAEIDAVYMVYNEFKSVISQRVVVEKLLPIRKLGSQEITAAEEMTEEQNATRGPCCAERGHQHQRAGGLGARRGSEEVWHGRSGLHLRAAPPDRLFRHLMPRYVTTQIFHALLESVAAEHAARMTAMDSATNNAGDMIDALSLTMNRVRQAAITKEIIEIVSGAAAL